jgi:hypothetical protein
MEIMTTDKKLLAQDDIDALLGEAGLEGGYKSDKTEELPSRVKTDSPVRFTKRSMAEAREALEILFKKTFFIRDDDIRVIWNASGNIPMMQGQRINIQGMEYVSLGILFKDHLVVKTG